MNNELMLKYVGKQNRNGMDLGLCLGAFEDMFVECCFKYT